VGDPFLENRLFGIGLYFWHQALGVVDATQTRAFLYFELFITVFLAWPILGETMSLGAITGGAAILLGV